MDTVIAMIQQAARIVGTSYPLTACELFEAAAILETLKQPSEDADRAVLSAHWHA